jgi:N-acetylneuraminic acid mutarotase
MNSSTCFRYSRFRLAWRALAVAALLAGCAERASQAAPPQPDGTLPEFIYDGQDQSWTSGPEEATLRAAALFPGDNSLSYETWTAAANAWGPIERNRSNGEKNAGDGRGLSIGGQSFAQGFGTHAGSSMSFALGGQCSTFTATVGVDDEVGDRGSVVFEVYADGTKVYDSGVMRGADGSKALSVNVTGKNELRLVVTNAGDGISYDHADWATPTLGGCNGADVPNAIRISAGGPPQTVNGVSWLGCQSVGSCQGYVTGGFAYGESDAISSPVAPANEAIYQREWTGGQSNGVPAGATAFAFAVPVPGGDYQVRLHFAELNKSAPGQRLFDVNLEGGAAELVNFDVFKEAGGAGRAIVRSFPVTVTDGRLNIDFVRRVENAKVSAIEILPLATAPAQGQDIDVTPAERVFSGVVNTVSAAQPVTVRNGGTAPLRLGGVTLTGTQPGAFRLVSPPAWPLTLQPGQSVDLTASFAPGGLVGSLSAALRIESDDPDEPARTVNLYGLSARGEQGDREPPLAQIVQTLGYRINVGSSGLILGTGSALIGDEVAAPLFVKAGSGPVTLRPVARYSPDDLLPFGYYTPGTAPARREVAVVARGGEQTLYPPTVSGGQDSFDPGSAAFGVYVGATSYSPRINYTQDALNTGSVKHAARVYPLMDRAGQPLANQYLIGFEPAVNGDYQDAVFLVGNVKPAPAASAVTWTPRAAAPQAISEAQGLAVNGRLYVFGGFTGGLRGTPRSNVYDPAADRWTALADMPEALTHAAVAADGTVIYVAGGFVGNHPGPQTNRVWKYDTARNIWSAGPPLPGARGGGALVRLGRNLHFFGGVERDLGNTNIYRRDSPEHWVLNLDNAGAGWKTAAPLPNPRNHLAGVALDGRLYAVGGQRLGDEIAGNQSTVQMYDPATSTWTARAGLPLPLAHMSSSAVVWNGRIVVAGGVTQNSAEVADVSEYDPAANVWTALTPLPAARQSPVADVIGGRMIVTTGSLPDGNKATTWSGGR